MSEFSWSWTCGTGDGTQVTQELLASTFSLTSNLNPSDSGVIYWTETNTGALQGLGLTNAIDGLLNATESGGIVTVDTGAAIVTGWLYASDETTDFDINGSPGNANATDIVALRRDTTAGTVRLVRLNGGAGAVATLTQTSGTWEIPVWYIGLDGSGEFSSISDRRRWSQDCVVFKVDDEIALSSSATTVFDSFGYAEKLEIQYRYDTGADSRIRMRVNSYSTVYNGAYSQNFATPVDPDQNGFINISNFTGDSQTFGVSGLFVSTLAFDDVSASPIVSYEGRGGGADDQYVLSWAQRSLSAGEILSSIQMYYQGSSATIYDLTVKVWSKK